MLAGSLAGWVIVYFVFVFWMVYLVMYYAKSLVTRYESSRVSLGALRVPGCLADWVGGLLVIACEAAMLMDSSSLGSSILLSTSCMTYSLYL